MKRFNFFVRVSRNKYYKFGMVNNNKYNKCMNRGNISVIKNFDVRGDIRYGDFMLCNTYCFCNKFVKCFK